VKAVRTEVKKERKGRRGMVKPPRKMAEMIKKEFPELFLASPYATREDRKQALLGCMESARTYTIEQLRRKFMSQFKVPISRVSINTYLNELDVEGKVTFKRRGRGGTKIVRLVT